MKLKNIKKDFKKITIFTGICVLLIVEVFFYRYTIDGIFYRHLNNRTI